MLQPKRVKFRKVMRGHRRGIATAGTVIQEGDWALKALETGWISSRQIEAARRAIVRSLREHEVWLVSYVPDAITWNVLSKLEEDAAFRTVAASREEEAVGIAAGAYAAQRRSAVFMQSSGFGNTVNALAQLLIAYRIPVPPPLRNHGNTVCSLNKMVGWLAGVAESRGIDPRGIHHQQVAGFEQLGQIVDVGVPAYAVVSTAYHPA